MSVAIYFITSFSPPLRPPHWIHITFPSSFSWSSWFSWGPNIFLDLRENVPMQDNCFQQAPPVLGMHQALPCLLIYQACPFWGTALLWPLEVFLMLHVSDKNLPGPPKPRPLRKTTSPSSWLGSLRVILSLLMNLCGCSFVWGRVTEKLWGFVCGKVLGRVFQIRSMGEPGVAEAGLGEKEESELWYRAFFF